MIKSTTFRSQFIASAARFSFRGMLPVLLLVATGCGAQMADQTPSSQTDLPSVANNSFTWASIDYTVRRASLVKSAAGSVVQLDLEAKNRIPYSTISLLDWDLELVDGAPIAQTDNRWFNLEPGQTQAFSLQFPVGETASLTGAQLAPRQADLNYAPAHIPLDRAQAEAPLILHELVGKSFATQALAMAQVAPELSTTPDLPTAPDQATATDADAAPDAPSAQDVSAEPAVSATDSTLAAADAAQRSWSVTVRSAQLSRNSDVDGGERALVGHQFVDIVFDVYYPATNSGDAYFGADLAAVEVNGSPGYELFDSAILKPNQSGQVHFAFEIPDDATEFVLHLDTNDASPQTLTVPLAQHLR